MNIRVRLRGLSWCVAAGAALLGAPWFFFWRAPAWMGHAAGWPLPTHFPGLEEVTHALTHHVGPEFGGELVLGIAWMAWLWGAAIPFALEAAAVLARRPTPAMPLGMGQAWAARVVAGVLLLFGPIADRSAGPVSLHATPAVATRAIGAADGGEARGASLRPRAPSTGAVMRSDSPTPGRRSDPSHRSTPAGRQVTRRARWAARFARPARAAPTVTAIGRAAASAEPSAEITHVVVRRGRASGRSPSRASRRPTGVVPPTARWPATAAR